MTVRLVDPYTSYYLQQAGSGIGSFYKGASNQKGRGIGSFLGGLFRSAIPLFKSGARALGQEALRAGLNVIHDIGDNANPKEAFKRRAGEAGIHLLDRASKKIKTMSGGGRKRGPLKRVVRRKKPQSKTSRRRVSIKTKSRRKTRKPAAKRRKTSAKRKTSTRRLRDIFD